MAEKPPFFEIGDDLIEAIRDFPVSREREHCGIQVILDPFQSYATCPRCGV